MEKMKLFANRSEAGKMLADMLNAYKNNKQVIVLALPRGGVPVGYEIATALGVPLDVFIVRKLGVPFHHELAMGAIATSGTVVFNEDIIDRLDIPQTDIDNVIASELQELERREKIYRGTRPFPDLTHKIIILVDDGIATGATLRAAIAALYKKNPTKIVVAVPVAAFDTAEEIALQVDELICPLTPRDFNAVGAWYENFSQVTDEEVQRLLKILFGHG